MVMYGIIMAMVWIYVGIMLGMFQNLFGYVLSTLIWGGTMTAHTNWFKKGFELVYLASISCRIAPTAMDMPTTQRRLKGMARSEF